MKGETNMHFKLWLRITSEDLYWQLYTVDRAQLHNCYVIQEGTIVNMEIC